MPPPDSEHDQWFRDHVIPHEPMLRAWLRSQFPDETDVDDVVQESSIRILRAKEKGEVTSPKAFLFATARNLVIGRVRKQIRQATFSLADLDKLGVLDEGEDVRTAIARSEELELLTQAIQSLPDRCRQIITLRKIYGMSQQNIASELGLSENTVVNQGTIGMSKLRRFFQTQEGLPPKRHD
jgi:RNA polymerase sigma-70 factor (ECF subfamily)